MTDRPYLEDLCKAAWPTNKGYTDKQKEWLGKVVAPLNRKITDLLYMQEALVQMLGPKGREVWAAWQANGLIRTHTSWAIDPMTLPGEDIAQLHLEMAEACKNSTPIEDIDAEITRLNRREH